MEITRKSITAKLGFDPMHPPKWEGDINAVDDHTPSIWTPLNKEELAFVFELLTGEKIQKYTGEL